MNKVLFVEDGSVDIDELQEMLPEVPIIIYRQGSLKPEFQDVDTTVKVVKKEPFEPEGMCADKADPTFTPEEIRASISAALCTGCGSVPAADRRACSCRGTV